MDTYSWLDESCGTVGVGRGDEEGCVCSMAGSKPSFSFSHRKAEQTRGFAVEPVKLVWGSLGLFSSVFFGKLAVCRSVSSGALLTEA